MSIGGDFQVEPGDLSKAGNSAAELGAQMLRDSEDVPAPAKSVLGGLDGFALAGALGGCTKVWDDKLASVAQQTRDAGQQLLNTAGTYQSADAAAHGGFDKVADALGQSSLPG